jgi:hypothetical protein
MDQMKHLENKGALSFVVSKDFEIIGTEMLKVHLQKRKRKGGGNVNTF